MKVLIADDDRVIRRILEAALTEWGYGAVAVADGRAAWDVLQAPDAPRFAILDWLMPGLDGLEVCRRARELPTRLPPYLLLLTVRDSRPDIVAGLQGGADDYMTKPFDHNELHARLQTGLRILRLQEELAAELRRSQQALELVKQLQGLLPICGYCKRIRDGHNAWQQLEAYISAHSEARFSHGVCPRCWEEHVGPELRRISPPEPGVG
jgi:DNA-binding response OmpR family regulator